MILRLSLQRAPSHRASRRLHPLCPITSLRTHRSHFLGPLLPCLCFRPRPQAFTSLSVSLGAAAVATHAALLAAVERERSWAVQAAVCKAVGAFCLVRLALTFSHFRIPTCILFTRCRACRHSLF